jgi:hypothetical protein
MSPRCRTVVTPRELQNMLACFLRAHAELVLGRPTLDTGDRRPRTEAVRCRFAVEGNRDFDVPTAVQMGLDAAGADVLTHNQQLVNRLITIFEEDEQVLLEAVLLGQDRLDGGEAMVFS